MSDNDKKHFVCVNCGNPANSLFKQYSPTVLKLCNCEFCDKVVDKYLEYDKVIILIDLILFSKEAYRHILYNVQYKGHFKLATLQLMTISFEEWFYSKNPINTPESETFYESSLYLICLATVLGKFTFLFVILLLINLHSTYTLKKSLVQSHVKKILEAIVCSSFGFFLYLRILIWSDFQREIHLIFINTYVLLSQIQALTVTTEVSKPLLGAICVSAAAVDFLLTAWLKWNWGV